MGHKIDATCPDLDVRVHRPQNERGIGKISQHVVKAGKKLRIFFQLLELGYERFPHSITAVRIRNCVQGFTNIHLQSTPSSVHVIAVIDTPHNAEI